MIKNIVKPPRLPRSHPSEGGELKVEITLKIPLHWRGVMCNMTGWS